MLPQQHFVLSENEYMQMKYCKHLSIVRKCLSSDTSPMFNDFSVLLNFIFQYHRKGILPQKVYVSMFTVFPSTPTLAF